MLDDDDIDHHRIQMAMISSPVHMSYASLLTLLPEQHQRDDDDDEDDDESSKVYGRR